LTRRFGAARGRALATRYLGVAPGARGGTPGPLRTVPNSWRA
jgi:hypothetical protein